jgi:nitrite reductase/ring-hydroxylating ferredoxin subunit
MEHPSQIEQHIPPNEIVERLSRLAPGTVVTHDGLDVIYDGYVRDMEWGVFDLIHRIYVHGTYANFIPLVSSKDVSVLVTPWQRLPLYLQVTTARLAPGFFYQSFSVLGLLYCHQMSKMTQEGDKTRVVMDWYIASHRFLKFLHPIFNRRLRKLQNVQNAEDVPVRDRRLALRKRGIKFATDVPDFINSNDLRDHVILPKLEAPVRFSLSALDDRATTQITFGAAEFLIRREGNDILVWPSLCPHEGALMRAENLCGDKLSCPWHGRTFTPTRLRAGAATSMRYLGLIISRQGDDLIAESGT